MMGELSPGEQLFVYELEELLNEYHPDGMAVSEMELEPMDVAEFRLLVDDALQRIYERD